MLLNKCTKPLPQRINFLVKLISTLNQNELDMKANRFLMMMMIWKTYISISQILTDVSITNNEAVPSTSIQGTSTMASVITTPITVVLNLSSLTPAASISEESLHNVRTVWSDAGRGRGLPSPMQLPSPIRPRLSAPRLSMGRGNKISMPNSASLSTFQCSFTPHSLLTANHSANNSGITNPVTSSQLPPPSNVSGRPR